ncbi:N-acetylmuramoyl-L-alanine amidase [Amycolatopsis thermoflava]|uniref:N-acetylmuramoyl-L-alanine amidase n=1 Tax=Amycolatopsis thermoflava TaxID=84480 RepID=UPI0004040500|nr:N-acetylmuramoyl-L-alanine amidase [Amycolatopsis thermoflava]
MRPRHWGSLLCVLTAAVAVLSAPAAAQPAARPVAPEASTVALANAPEVAPGAREVPAQEEFSLAGLTWRGAAPDTVSVRWRSAAGGWSDWRAVDRQDSGRDGAPAPSTTEPIWTGPADRLQVRAERGGAPVTAELSAVLVDPGTSPADAMVAQATGVPSMPAVVTRAQWGADESLMTWTPEYAPTVKAVTLHHTDNSNDYTCDQSAELVRGIYYYHAVTNGWGDIGYNALVDKCGTVFEGRAGGLNLPTIGAHAGGFNTSTFGISMLGTYTTVAPTEATLDAVARLTAWKLGNGYTDPSGSTTLVSRGGGTSKYPAGTEVTLPTVFGHRDVGATECPGDAGYAQLPALRTRATELAGDWRSSPVHQKWVAVGTAAAGPVYAVEADWPGGGRATTFGAGGSTIAWRSDLGAYWVRGAIHGTFTALGGPSLFGYPTTDERGTPDGVGRYNHFSENASIYFTPDTGAHGIHGPIRDKWAARGWETGLGYPRTDQKVTPDGVGRYNHFTGNSSVYWTADTGAQAVQGAIRDTWSALGWETSPLAYPTTDERATPDGVGRYNHFNGSGGGSIYWTPGTGARAIYGAIRARWSALGWEAGPLGYPTTNELVTPDGVGRYNHFNGSGGGSVYWSPGTGAHAIYGVIRSHWASLGWETSWLGYPTSDEYGVAGGRRSDFQGGYIVFSFATGKATAYRY